MIETNFKHTDIGLIPHDWEVRIIKDFADITTGSQNTQDRIDNGEYPFFVRSSKVERINKYIFDTEGVITAGDGVGTGKIYHYINGKFGLHQRCYLVYNFERVSAKYFYQIFGQHFYDRVQGMTAKSSVDSVRMEMIADMPIPLPPTLAEQEKIANALSKIDQLINDLGALIEKKKAIKQGTMQDLLTAKRRLKGFTGEWKEKQLKEICERYDNLRVPISAKLRKKGNTPYYGANGIQDYVEGYTHDGEFILIAEDGANSLTNYPIKYVIGKIWVNNHAHVITAKDEKTNNVYLSYALKCVDFKSNIVGSGRAKLNADTLMQLSVVIPPTLAEQNAIANILSSMDTEIINLEQKRNKYIVIKQGMMQNLLTGKIRLI